MVSDTGLEPAPSSPQPGGLPVIPIRVDMVEMERIELPIPACKTGVFPLALHPRGGSEGGIRTHEHLLCRQRPWTTRPPHYDRIFMK